MQKIFISFVTERYVFENNHKNVLSSEAGCNIIVIIRRTRSAQTASHVDLLVSLRDTRIENNSDNSTSSKDLFVRNVFEIYSQRHGAQSVEEAEKIEKKKVIPKTFRTRRSLEVCKFFESILSLGLHPQSEQRNTKCCLSGASSLSDLKNLCTDLRARTFWGLLSFSTN